MKMFKGQPLRQMIDIARVADELNFDYLCLAEHVLMHGHPSMAAHSTGPVRHTPAAAKRPGDAPLVPNSKTARR